MKKNVHSTKKGVRVCLETEARASKEKITKDSRREKRDTTKGEKILR